MINTKHLVKVTLAWTSIVYAVCFLGVAISPAIRPWFLEYGFHVKTGTAQDILTPVTFISGLIIWNVIAVLAVWLFAALHNSIKK